MIPYNILPNDDNPIVFDSTEIKYVQKGDCCQNGDDYQELSICIADGGGGPYLLLKTNRWAISNLSELANIINDFNEKTKIMNTRKRLNL